ncbi:MAG: hypothetical protein HY259_04230 [Chloroflexi bacterium]|nr:hypothetical protein [Chloroflexota bacterium]
MKNNRPVSLNFQDNRPVSELPIAASGTFVHLKGYSLIRVFKGVTPDGDIEYWATNDFE